MRLLLVLAVVFVVYSLTTAQQTRPCKSPPYLMGKLVVSLKDEVKFWNYEYNRALQRMRVYETENLVNRSLTNDFLLHFGEGVTYEMDGLTSTCSKRPLRADYQPIGIPDDATSAMPLIFGSLSVPGGGMQVNSWQGLSPRGEEYIKFVTEVGCVPHQATFYTEKHGQVTIVFLNSTVHNKAQDDLSPPGFCPEEDAQPTGRPVDLLELFLESRIKKLKRTFSKLINVYLNNYSFL
ncbi:hypothetical protein NL108_016803 [Boleophthalmus pectinirostris]|uniref:ependymin-2-like n=1 Tax=Boleophthalmus pectinirostris TaxID=150288 RepID=UPI000A1C51CD|nr:ependymin-2-like [Boleophthalmus pectinirostris]XP_055012815.1 ependymin-2-like [Boleophthalmus pectinirostris]KAJ0055858.1 hypothetical protein NL108_013993 [Boleophthalmus pectinirostris]KAJ0055951.1 hypothetical protein NL108_016803 [Boleophthalmus pectinirostris]